MEPREPLTQFPAVRLSFFDRSVRLSPLKPNQMPTTACWGSVGTVAAVAGWLPLSTTRGRYTDSAPVLVLTIVASTKADCPSSASSQPPFAGSVAVSWYGVARPLALSGLDGTMRVQSAFGSVSA